MSLKLLASSALSHDHADTTSAAPHLTRPTRPKRHRDDVDPTMELTRLGRRRAPEVERSQMRASRRRTALVTFAALMLTACVTDFGPATVTFDGTRCTYDGLPEWSFEDGAHDMTVTFNNRADVDAGLSIWKIPPRMAIDGVVADGPRAHLDAQVDMRGVGQASPGESLPVNVHIDAPGWWVLNCFTDDLDYTAEIRLVTED